MRGWWKGSSGTYAFGTHLIIFKNVIGSYFGDKKYWSVFGLTPSASSAFTTSNTQNSDLNKVLDTPSPTISDYFLEDRFFGSHTEAGITYTWEKLT